MDLLATGLEFFEGIHQHLSTYFYNIKQYEVVTLKQEFSQNIHADTVYIFFPGVTTLSTEKICLTNKDQRKGRDSMSFILFVI